MNSRLLGATFTLALMALLIWGLISLAESSRVTGADRMHQRACQLEGIDPSRCCRHPDGHITTCPIPGRPTYEIVP
jgi:hypothetical protein